MTALTMSRGDTKFVTETVGPTGLGANGIQNWQFWMTAKRDAGDPDSAAIFQKLPAAWTITQQGSPTLAGIVTCTLAPADTSALPPYQVVLVYDVTAQDTNSNEFTIDSGTITVTPDITLAV